MGQKDTLTNMAASLLSSGVQIKRVLSREASLREQLQRIKVGPQISGVLSDQRATKALILCPFFQKRSADLGPAGWIAQVRDEVV